MSKGFCECGCGEKTKIAKFNHAQRNQLAGEPRRYVFGHNRRMSPVRYVVDKETGCWDWKRFVDKSGYGLDKKERKTQMAYRIEYEKKYGEVPKGLELDHLCRNRLCVNPDHLEAVTHEENMRRSPAVTKLSFREVTEIRKIGNTKTKKEVAKMFKITTAYVGQLLNNKWRKNG